MNNSAKAMDYARILFEVCEEENLTTDVLYELNTLRKMKAQEVNRLLTIPIVPEHIKIELANSFAELNISQTVINFIKVLISRHDFYVFVEVIEEYKKLYQSKEDIQVVNIYTARELSSENLDILVKELEQRLNKFVVLSSMVDEKLIGGIKIEYEGKEVDNTIKKHLNDFINRMTRS